MASSDSEGGASSSGRTKRPRLSQDTSKHLVGYRQLWESEFTWLIPVETDGLVTGMLCRLCQRHKTKNKYNHSPVWSSTPCISSYMYNHTFLYKSCKFNLFMSWYASKLITINIWSHVTPKWVWNPQNVCAHYNYPTLLFFSAENPEWESCRTC